MTLKRSQPASPAIHFYRSFHLVEVLKNNEAKIVSIQRNRHRDNSSVRICFASLQGRLFICGENLRLPAKPISFRELDRRFSVLRLPSFSVPIGSL